MHDATPIEDLAHRLVSEPGPEEALRALTQLRAECSRQEKARVAQALREGLTWSRIAASLGVSKQAAHRKHRGAREPRARDG